MLSQYLVALMVTMQVKGHGSNPDFIQIDEGDWEKIRAEVSSFLAQL